MASTSRRQSDWWAGGRKVSGFYDAIGNCGSDPDKNEDMPNCRH